MVVESPGKLPGLVKVDNMRYTHFSRNPKIAEFLKTFNFVKEYGEGVNRMCKELETVGLKEPQYFTNAFILQATIYNAKEGQNSLSKILKTVGNVAVNLHNQVIGNENVAIGRKKLAIDTLKQAIDLQNYNKPTIENIIEIYNNIEDSQIFSSSDIAKILNCAPSNARTIMNKLKALDVVVEVKGKGKGKYCFKYIDE